YTNGCHIADKRHEIMENGEEINPGLYQNTTYCLLYYPTYQGALFLPDPGNENQYYLFHMALDEGISNPYFAGQRYYFSLVNATANQGNGSVVDKNHLLLEDAAVGGYIAAVKHANGRDWWIVSPHHVTNRYYRFLLDPQGVHGPYVQEIGDTLPSPCCGMTLFSTDGNKYFRSTTPSGLQILDFDRCTGTFSNPVFIPADSIGFSGPAGLATSHDSRYLYVSTNKYLFQYDLQATNIPASRFFIAQIDSSYYNPEKGTFHHARLAPDGKIYLMSLNYVPEMAVINFPERQGLACKADQHGYQLPSLFGNDLIFNFPHFRLGPIDGSSCDSLGIDNVPVAQFRWDFEDSLSPRAVTFTEVCDYETTQWHWSFGDGTTSPERNPAHVYTADGVYEVCLTATNANGSNTLCKTLTLGISAQNNPSGDALFQVFPNPCSDVLFLSNASDWQRPAFQIRDVQGRLLLQKDLGTGMIELSMQGLPNGIYFWELQSVGVRVKGGKVLKVD
ncbi:MAG: PKD domain-containing protein, partial [Saprospiraceae bacterium]|nr:PKD domain-containing protein [Saprospiraceae bacterium]